MTPSLAHIQDALAIFIYLFISYTPTETGTSRSLHLYGTGIPKILFFFPVLLMNGIQYTWTRLHARNATAVWNLFQGSLFCQVSCFRTVFETWYSKFERICLFLLLFRDWFSKFPNCRSDYARAVVAFFSAVHALKINPVDFLQPVNSKSTAFDRNSLLFIWAFCSALYCDDL